MRGRKVINRFNDSRTILAEAEQWPLVPSLNC